MPAPAPAADSKANVFAHQRTAPGMDSEATVAAVRTVGPDAVAISFETPAGFEARPGEFVQLGARVDGEEIVRFYTVSSPRTGETFEVTLTVDPEGDLSPHLASLSPGDEVDVSGPFGSAVYDGEPAVLALAGGPGSGAALGVAERAVEDDARAAVVYVDDAPLHEERLATLRERGAHVSVLAPGDDLEAAVGTALETLEDHDPTALVYGFADFVAAAREALTAAGLDPGTDAVKTESFGPAPESEA
jgi:ferredoxin-NADP reductase